MRCRSLPVAGLCWVALVCAPAPGARSQDDVDPTVWARYREAALNAGDAERGRAVFQSKEAGCAKCHAVAGGERKAGPDLSVVGDKYSREQLIQSVLEPSALMHPDYGTIVVTTTQGKVHTGVLRTRSDAELQLLDGESQLVRIAVPDIETEQRSATSLMPAGLHKSLTIHQFADLIAYVTTLRQGGGAGHPGLAADIPWVNKKIRLEPMHSEAMRFDHPVWIIALPGSQREFLVVEQMTRQVWRFVPDPHGGHKELFVDLSDEATTGQFEGVVCLAFHPQFLVNRKYYLNYHVRQDGKFSPVIAERQASPDFKRDAGVPSRRLLQIEQGTDLHWGGMLAFGPDGYLYIGAGDGGPQEDPEGHGQDLSLLLGSILRIDVDRADPGLPYAIPESNPFRNGNAAANVRREIWAYGFRMPWRFSFDPLTNDLWVGDIGQNLFEEVTIARGGENHGWNVYEAFTEFSNQYRREGLGYTPPVVSYRRREGVSVTGGYVYRGCRSPTYYGAYIFGDFESKRIWAMTQADRKLVKIRQIGESPERFASFGLDSDGELLLVGYDGMIFRLNLDESVFE